MGMAQSFGSEQNKRTKERKRVSQRQSSNLCLSFLRVHTSETCFHRPSGTQRGMKEVNCFHTQIPSRLILLQAIGEGCIQAWTGNRGVHWGDTQCSPAGVWRAPFDDHTKPPWLWVSRWMLLVLISKLLSHQISSHWIVDSNDSFLSDMFE